MSGAPGASPQSSKRSNATNTSTTSKIATTRKALVVTEPGEEEEIAKILEESATSFLPKNEKLKTFPSIRREIVDQKASSGKSRGSIKSAQKDGDKKPATSKVKTRKQTASSSSSSCSAEAGPAVGPDNTTDGLVKKSGFLVVFYPDEDTADVQPGGTASASKDDRSKEKELEDLANDDEDDEIPVYWFDRGDDVSPREGETDQTAAVAKK
ncbi:unnamed protein product [Amoebophrya sp. A120]|nr:unnamed protein product [Amoebophrya sp. A120]|eukprot:GSA120T00012582001.1